jgi:hypothetical protein
MFYICWLVAEGCVPWLITMCGYIDRRTNADQYDKDPNSVRRYILCSPRGAVTADQAADCHRSTVSPVDQMSAIQTDTRSGDQAGGHQILERVNLMYFGQFSKAQKRQHDKAKARAKIAAIYRDG